MHEQVTATNEYLTLTEAARTAEPAVARSRRRAVQSQFPEQRRRELEQIDRALEAEGL